MGASRVAELQGLFGVEVGGEELGRVRVYLEMLAKWNRMINLTSIDRVEEQLRLSFFEGFWAARLFIAEELRVADIGSGAGFPGVPIKIFLPSVAMTLIEPSGKKAAFLEEGCRAAQVAARVFCGRAEDYPEWPETDLATVRALKLPRPVERRLKEEGVSILAFHGKTPEVDEKLFTLERRELVPGSVNRYVSLYR